MLNLSAHWEFLSCAIDKTLQLAANSSEQQQTNLSLVTVAFAGLSNFALLHIYLKSLVGGVFFVVSQKPKT